MTDAPPTDPKLVFVVEDNPLLGQVTAQIIETAGFTTQAYTDALEARRKLAEVSPLPCVLVTDYDLGPIVGFELIELVRSRNPAVKCLLVSGTVKREVLERHPTQSDRFLPKPFKADELLAYVNELAVR
ncbi:MAG: response regulator [Limisphaerales bacterium]